MTAEEYITHLGLIFNIKRTTTYHKAHTSSKKNNKVGDWVGLGRWDINEIMNQVLPMLQGGAVFHPPLSPILFTPYEPKTEEDGIVYSHFAIFDPVITILQGYFPSLEIRAFSEDTHVGTIGSEPAESRMDVLLKARPFAFRRLLLSAKTGFIAP
jgi:hypothetical protein